MTNYSTTAELLNPGERVGEVRLTSVAGKVAKRWKLSLLAVGIFTYTSVVVSRAIIRGIVKSFSRG